MSQTKAQLVSGTTAQDLTVDNINTSSINSGQVSNRNKVINGSMMIHQRGDAAATGSAAYLSCDRFLTNNGSGAQVAVSKSTDTPDGFSASTKWDCTTADSSVAASDYFIIQHRMEGQNLQDFAKGSSSAKQYALSFYIKATKTGVYTVELEDVDNARVCSKTITVSDNNWNRYTIIYPADTTGTTNNDNGNSLSINFWLLAGSDYNSGTLQSSAWGTRTNANRASSSNVNALDSTSNDFLLTGVQLEVGGTVTDFEHRSFAQELQLCQRYYYVLASGATKFMCIGDFWLDAQADGGIVLPVEMRATPTLDHTNGSDYYRVWTNGANSHIDGAISLWNRSHNKAVTWYATPDVNRTAGHANRWITNNASAHFAFSAEL
tara:strand:- start:122 stop:1255 length:1134 start_codon:yes stop_codon:yes gene_type:complete